jgi:hypothetical protein
VRLTTNRNQCYRYAVSSPRPFYNFMWCLNTGLTFCNQFLIPRRGGRCKRNVRNLYSGSTGFEPPTFFQIIYTRFRFIIFSNNAFSSVCWGYECNWWIGKDMEGCEWLRRGIL